MNPSNPVSSIIPSAHGTVLGVLARTAHPLSGRRITELADGAVGQSRVSEVLRQLADAGIVLCEEHPPAKLYVLNRQHVGADAIVALARLREQLLERMRKRLATWSPAPAAAWLFGSFATGDGGVHSDIDVFVVRPDSVLAEDAAWTAQVDSFTNDVAAWSGNECSVIEYSDHEFSKLVADDERLVADLRRDGIHLAGSQIARRARVTTR
jgi:predicted nucleotidyltransferase